MINGTQYLLYNTKLEVQTSFALLSFRPIFDERTVTMTTSNKRQKRDEYRKTHKEEGTTELPKKKFYRQRAHANPFSDHQLT